MSLFRLFDYSLQWKIIKLFLEIGIVLVLSSESHNAFQETNSPQKSMKYTIS